jgi:hypothetical protein
MILIVTLAVAMTFHNTSLHLEDPS